MILDQYVAGRYIGIATVKLEGSEVVRYTWCQTKSKYVEPYAQIKNNENTPDKHHEK